MTDELLRKCPKCAGLIHRLISAAGIVFKGNGFYVTDYKRGAGTRDEGLGKIEKKTEKASPPKVDQPSAEKDKPQTSKQSKTSD